jgi:hypothetical protein
MSDNYLWDRSGKPDPEVQKLEEMLGQFRHDVPAPDFSKASGVVREFPRRRWVRWMAIAAAAAIVLFVADVWFAHRPGPAALQVARLGGTPVVAGKPMKGTDTLAVGEYLVTDGKSRARIDVGLIGEVQVDPNSRVGLLSTRPTEHRLALHIGTMHARIWAPPGLFFVETPSATAVDLGCRYTLTVDNSGAGFLHVTLGQVAFEWRGRESFVPAGAMCQTRPGIGPGTPYREDAPEALRAALEEFDFVLGGVAGGVEGPKNRRAEVLDAILANARKEDALTLWHLLTRTSAEERGRVYDRLVVLAPPKDDITRDGVLASNQKMLDQWWVQISGRKAPMSWWRMWKGPAPQVP